LSPSIEEAADIMEVFQAICDLKKIDLKNLEEVKGKKAQERGKFEKKIILTQK
jgi:predicted house-cleaning noncanonical NTP pyrophosphatase (MazG superfamily)